jgi:hypothetical protein
MLEDSEAYMRPEITVAIPTRISCMDHIHPLKAGYAHGADIRKAIDRVYSVH